MRKDLLLKAEEDFLMVYPEGFESPGMEKIKKKHKIDKMHILVTEVFDKDKFDNIEEIIQYIYKIVSKSSLVSVFEKAKFKDFINNLENNNKEDLANGVKELLHGDQEKGFNEIIDVLDKGKLAKWPIVSIIPFYFNPLNEVFLKPTTVKNVIKIFELEGLKYKPMPSYKFYIKYKKQINEMSKIVNEKLVPDNAAFSGFLMIAMEGLKSN